MNRRPIAGEIYRHFKNKEYKIITIAKHSETGEELVIYQALYGDGLVCARPLDMFVSEVDREKYPDVKQQYRFEKIADASETDGQVVAGSSKDKPLARMTAEEKMMLFFDEDDLEAKYKILLAMREDITDTMIDNMAVVLDVIIPDGDITMRYDDLKRAVQTKQRYEQTLRLR